LSHPFFVGMTEFLLQNGVFLLLAVAASAFLILCVRQNARSGYQHRRVQQSMVSEGLQWIAALEASLSCEPRSGVRVPEAEPKVSEVGHPLKSRATGVGSHRGPNFVN
jgi:hypothetical protein